MSIALTLLLPWTAAPLVWLLCVAVLAFTRR